MLPTSITPYAGNHGRTLLRWNSLPCSLTWPAFWGTPRRTTCPSHFPSRLRMRSGEPQLSFMALSSCASAEELADQHGRRRVLDEGARAVGGDYLAIKDDPFFYGNKRIGSLLFLDYLGENSRPLVEENALVEDIIVRLIIYRMGRCKHRRRRLISPRHHHH